MKPFFDKNNIAILSGCNDNYIPYLSVLISSILVHISTEYNYDIILFEFSISNQNKQKIRAMSKQYNNVSIRFCNINHEIEVESDLWKVGRWSKELYISLLAPYILQEYEKIIYMDCDVINLYELSSLYNIDITGYLLGASRLFAKVCEINNGFLVAPPHSIHQMIGYVNNGVMLINLKEFRKIYSFEQVISLINEQNFPLLDQDCINYLCRECILYVDAGWNAYPYTEEEFNNSMLLCPNEYKEYFQIGYQEKKNIHYTIPVKLWYEPFGTYSYAGMLFWEYAKKSPYYDEILNHMIDYQRKKEILNEYENKSWNELESCKYKYQIFIYGYGNNGKKFMESFRDKYEIAAIIDKKADEISIDNIEVVQPKAFIENSINNRNSIILITNEIYETIFWEFYEEGFRNIFLYVCMEHRDRNIRYEDYKNIVQAMSVFSEERSKYIFNKLVNKRIEFRQNKNAKCADIYEGNMYYFFEKFHFKENSVMVDIGRDSKYTSNIISNCKKYKNCKILYYENINTINNLPQFVDFIKINVVNTIEVLEKIKVIVEKCYPDMAINVSNQGSDLWDIPLYIMKYYGNYEIFIRHHSTNFGNTVIYLTKSDYESPIDYNLEN